MTATRPSRRQFVCASSLAAAGAAFGAWPADASMIVASADPIARLQWWRAARFGLFIHWGPVSLQGTEIGWSRAGERRGYKWGPGKEVPVEVYDNLYKRFNPTRFDADAWVSMAKASGMRYLVFTSRHHDGFSMFDTRADDYSIMSPASPFRRDVVKALADACHRAGLRFGLYYSQPNWRHPDAFTMERHAAYLAFLRTQVRELLTNYGKIDILWYDGLGKSAEEYDGVALNRMARELQPDLVINDRNGLPEDFATPEQEIGTFSLERPWESCITICRQWAWKPDDQLKSLKECLDTLVRCAGGDGNLLLNVGPMPDGRVEPRQADRLLEVGTWLSKYGDSIYGTRGGPWKPTESTASTRKANTIYLHVLRWDGESVSLPGLSRRVVRSRLLTGGQVDVKQADGRLTVFVPAASRQPLDTLVALELDGSAMELAAV
jgi:alpha-L-fucosidase